MYRNMIYKFVCLLIGSLILLSAVAGCDSSKKDSGETGATTKKESTAQPESTTSSSEGNEKKTEIVAIESIWLSHDMTVPVFEFDIFRTEIEKRLGVHLDVNVMIYTTQDDYNKRLTLLAASGEWPEFLFSDIFTFTTSVLNTAGEHGFLHDFTEDIKAQGREKYAELAQTGIEFNKNPSDGKLYKLPAVVSGVNPHIGASAATNLRIDLLDKLGVDFPKDPDEFYDLLKLIKAGGRSADGSEMIPLSLPEGIFTGQGWISYMLFNNWIQNNEWEWDESTNMFVRPIWSNYEGFEKLCGYFNRLYNEGLLDKETFIQKNDQLNQKMAQGKVGVSSLAYWTLKGINNSLEQVDPDMYYGYMPPFPDTSVVDSYKGTSYWTGGYGVVAVSNKISNEKLDAIWKLMEYMTTEEGSLLAVYGVENETYTYNEKDEYYDYTEEVYAKINENKGYLSSIGLKLYNRLLHNYPFIQGNVSPNNEWLTRRDYKQMAKITQDYRDGLLWERTCEAFFVDAGPVEAARDASIREAQADLFVQAVTSGTPEEALELAKTWPKIAENLGLNLIYEEKMELVQSR